MRLEQHKFSAWLRAKRPDEIVGQRGSCTGCPIALFHADVSGDEIAVLDSDHGFRIDRGDGGRLAPAWAEKFMRSIDGETARCITARRALEILAG